MKLKRTAQMKTETKLIEDKNKKNKKFELMRTRRAKAYSSFGSVV